MNAIFCNANTLMDVALIRELGDMGMNFVLITATEEIKYILKRYYDVDAGSLDEYRSLDVYNKNSAAEYDYQSSEYLQILDRYKVVGHLATKQKQLFFGNALYHWDAFLEDHHIEFVVFKMTPHLLYDFAIHELCEEKGIKKVIIEKTYWENIVLLQKTFRHNDCLVNPNGAGSVTDLTSRIKVKKMPYWTEAKLANQRRTEKKAKNVSGLNRLKSLLPGSIRAPVIREYGFYDGIYRSADEIRQYGLLRRFTVHRRIRDINDRILDEYHKSLIDYEKVKSGRNIVFYLQCQPEKSTSPLGGKYVDQLLAIGDLLSWIPEGYHLLVKEHPSQFTRWQSLDKGRFPGFYQSITNMGCSLISHTVDNQRLFESTKLTVSITGSTVFEAWILGYKAAFLGFPWYRIFDIKQACSKQDIEWLLNRPEADPTYSEKIRPLSSVGFRGYADEYSEKKFLIENDLRLAAEQMGRSINQYAFAA